MQLKNFVENFLTAVVELAPVYLCHDSQTGLLILLILEAYVYTTGNMLSIGKYSGLLWGV